MDWQAFAEPRDAEPEDADQAKAQARILAVVNDFNGGGIKGDLATLKVLHRVLRYEIDDMLRSGLVVRRPSLMLAVRTDHHLCVAVGDEQVDVLSEALEISPWSFTHWIGSD